MREVRIFPRRFEMQKITKKLRLRHIPSPMAPFAEGMAK